MARNNHPSSCDFPRNFCDALFLGVIMAKGMLLIEDDKVLSKMYAKKFGNEGWNVTVCHDGSQAPTIARGSAFDMIVLDLMLPGLPGIDVLEMLRCDKRTAMVPVVVYTNHGDEYNREKCMTYGADEFVLKVDTTPEGLSQTINKVYSAKNL
jgi:DNA-binding response OmpR family regulator